MANQPLLTVVVHDLALAPPLTGLCAGYELGKWRLDALADHLLEALPEFCLTYSERSASSLRAGRRAGIHVAATATNTRSATTPAIRMGSCGSIWYTCADNSFDATDAAGAPEPHQSARARPQALVADN